MIPQHTWVSKLFGYTFSVSYRPGHQNAAADALSRRDEDSDSAQALALSAPEFAIFDDFRKEADTLQDIIDKRREIARSGDSKLKNLKN